MFSLNVLPQTISLNKGLVFYSPELDSLLAVLAVRGGIVYFAEATPLTLYSYTYSNHATLKEPFDTANAKFRASLVNGTGFVLSLPTDLKKRTIQFKQRDKVINDAFANAGHVVTVGTEVGLISPSNSASWSAHISQGISVIGKRLEERGLAEHREGDSGYFVNFDSYASGNQNEIAARVFSAVLNGYGVKTDDVVPTFYGAFPV